MGPFSAKTTDRKKAQRELDKLLGKRARGEIVHAKRDKEKVGDLLGDDLAYADERLESARTIRWVIEANVRPAVGKLRIARCDVTRLRQYRKERLCRDPQDQKQRGPPCADLRRTDARMAGVGCE